MLKRRLLLLIPIFGVFISSSVLAAAKGDPAAGKEKSQACASCHGADGNSPSPQFPKLAGQNAGYIVHALTSYQTGKRENAMMQPMAASLSEQDKQDLAAYFASQKGLVLPWKITR